MRHAILALVTLTVCLTHTFAVNADHKPYRYLPKGRPISPTTLPYEDHTKTVICTNRPVPPGWIIVGVRKSVACNGHGGNAWVIQKLPEFPGADIIICGNQPVPPGWAAIESVRTVYCGAGTRGIRIRKL